MKLIYKLFKKIIISSFLLYGYNILVAPLNLIIPINMITVPVVAILGMPSLVSLSLILLFIY